MKQKQPIPKKGTEFTGWATANWGMLHQRVYRTRKQAKEACCDHRGTWEQVKSHMAVVKVKCIVL